MGIFDDIKRAILGQPPAQAATGSPAPNQSTQRAPVDVDAMLSERTVGGKKGLNWRQSIVDLLKLLDLDSSLEARKRLAQELGYTGALNGSAEMNIWLHRQVMKKLSEDGAKVPTELM